MFRLLILLGAAMFLTMQFGGQDRGQLRQGLMAASELAKAPKTKPTATSASMAEVEPTPTLVQANLPAITPPKPGVEAAFTPKIDRPAPVVESVAEVAELEPEVQMLYVKSNSINVRGGPSTNDDIIGRLSKNEAVSVVSGEVDGWVRIRIEGDGIEGFVAARLMTDVDPTGN